jgi:hypothetical protein
MYEEHAPPALPAAPQVTVLDTEAETVTVRLINSLDIPLAYSAERREQPGFFWEEMRHGEWSRRDWPQCGNGQQSFTLEPNAHLDINISWQQRQPPFRVYTLFSDPAGKRGGFVLLYEKK